ncbi:MAG: LysR family transcriptional regulator [Firmicutes bacterium]|nr:LysR family transcriptional regulator [Bacillota bacterium]
MNYNYLKYFQVLAQTQHYTQAAELLNISQPSLSHAIDEIEREIQMPLFEKQGRNIRLTKYGQMFYEDINSGLNEIKDGIKKMQTLSHRDTGTIDLGFIYTLGSYYIPNLIKSFLKDNPTINFNLKQGTSNTIVDLLESEELDIGFCSYVEDRKDINYIPILKEEMVLIVSNKHPLASKKSIDLTTLSKDEPWIIYSNRSGLRPYLNQIFSELEIEPKIRCEIEEDNAALGLVDINYGIALIPDLAFTDLHNVQKIRITNKLPERTIYLATKKNRFLISSNHLLINHIMHNAFDNRSIEV